MSSAEFRQLPLRVLAAGSLALGEGPTWDPAAGLVRWVDIDRGHLWQAQYTGPELGPARRALDLGATLGAAAPAADGGLLLARSRHLEHRDASGVRVGAVAVIPSGVPSRLNDGATDPDGRYVVGSLALRGSPRGQGLFRLERDGSLSVLDDDLTLANGIGWSPDGSTMYVVDTLSHRVYARDYSHTSTRVGPRSVLLDTGSDLPDGLAVDADGYLWIAFWGAGQVRRYAPDGRLVTALDTGAPLTTSCVFAGPDLDLLVVTSAGKDADGAQHTERSGSLLGCRPGPFGSPEPPWLPVPLPPVGTRTTGSTSQGDPR